MGKRELRARWRERYDRVPRQKRCLLVRSELCRILGVVKLRPKTFIRINPSGRANHGGCCVSTSMGNG